MKKWIKELIDRIDWKYILFCLGLFIALFVLSGILYLIFIKPTEDRVNAEWQEKYDEMVDKYEEKIHVLRSEYNDEYDSIRRESYDSGYDEGFAIGYSDGLDDGYDIGFSEGIKEGRGEGYDAGYEAGRTQGYEEAILDGATLESDND